MFELKYDTADQIPSELKYLYKEKDGAFVLLGAGEIKTTTDVEHLQEALRKERGDHKETKSKLSKFGTLAAEEVFEKLDRFDELEAAAKGKLDDSQIDEMVERRIKTRTAPLERTITELTRKNDESAKTIQTYENQNTTRSIVDRTREAAKAAKLTEFGIEDAVFMAQHIMTIPEGGGDPITKEGVGVTPNTPIDVWLTEMQEKRPNWWPPAESANAKSGNGYNTGTNPFSKEGWNLTEQGKLVQADRSKAERLAASAGTTIGGLPKES